MRGLTLLEVLVAIAILGIIMGAIYGTYILNVEAIQIARQKGQVYQIARIVLDRMTRDLESAFIEVDLPDKQIQLGIIGEDRETDGKADDRLDFTTLTHLPPNEMSPRTDLCEVGYQLVEDSENEGFILYRRDDGIPDDDLTDGGFSHDLIKGITGLDITFQNTHGEEFDNWNTIKGEPENGLPSLITIRLTIKDEEGQEHLFTTSIHPALAETKRGE